MQDKIIGIEKTAEILGISKASVRNWIKHGYFKDTDGKTFQASQVLQLKEDIESGKLDRLKRRANKARAKKRFVPGEYLINREKYREISRLIDYIDKNGLDKRMAIFIIALKLFQLNGDLKSGKLEEILPLHPDNFIRKAVYNELSEFLADILKSHKEKAINSASESASTDILSNEGLKYIYDYLLPSERDILGVVYQALTKEGKKASLGSYFTPLDIVESMVGENAVKGQKMLDPCCGTGQFLLSYGDRFGDADSIYGIDCDSTAVRIARINLLLRFTEVQRPKVFHYNTLEQRSVLRIGPFDFIATNPPWGANITAETLKELRIRFPEIRSGESFAYFWRISFSLLREGGLLSFVLPEAILNVRKHQDIRRFILENCRIKKIECLGRRFTNVLSSVIRLDVIKNKPCGDEEVLIIRSGEEYTVPQKRFGDNQGFVFDVYINKRDEQIIKKVFETKHITLEGKAEWALGIVTGDNRKFLKDKPADGYEPVYRGSEVGVIALKEPAVYIKFSPEAFQQVAPEAKYRAREKLIYRFISGLPVFAYDDQGRLTLNSANILIPQPDYPVKVILALFNSSLYGFIYRKKFNSIKVLRGDLEQLPLPLWPQEIFDNITSLVDEIRRGTEVYVKLDSFILEQFGLTSEEKRYIKSCLKSEYKEIGYSEAD